MPTEALDIATRVKSLNAVLTTKADRSSVDKAMQAANGNWPEALVSLQDKLSSTALQNVTLAHSLASWSDDHTPLVKALTGSPEINSLRDVALQLDKKKMTALIDTKTIPADTAGATTAQKKKNFAATLQQRLFLVETSAVLQRMAQDAELPIADKTIRAGVGSFLDNQPDFNIRTTSIYTALGHPEAFKDIAEEQRAGVIENLKTLQRVQAISPVAEAVPVLMKANLTSAFRVAEIPESTFLKAYSGSLGEQTAQQVYTNAINGHIRNEHALVTMRETIKGTGLAIIDGQRPMATRRAELQKVADKLAVPLNLSTLFGSLDYCECDECLSVYSPAAYFVELLQFLRNNNLGPDPATGDPDPAHNKNIHPGIIGTPLEKLFRRRPDLGCLELTCENTFTVLPYIDLVNEVMESFVVHLGDYYKNTEVPKQATLEAFNVEDETSSELLAIPQHINYEAYCILKSAVYPFTLPYHQPIDATRIFLNYLGTSRWELLDTFRTPSESCPGLALTPEQLKEMQALHQAVIDRAVDADYLGMTQEEYIILTREAFWPKRYFDLTQNKTFSVAEYEKNIGVRQVCEYYGYVAPANGSCDADMLSTNETAQLGLTLVKKQFLPRTGILYAELVDLLKTRFINPNFPQGKALTLLESVRFSYRFLQTLVDTTSADPKIRFGKLIDFLNAAQHLLPLLNARLNPDPCQQQKLDTCVDERKDFRNWVYCYFERIGKLIVLEAGEGPRLPIEGPLLLSDGSPASIGTLHSDGTITSEQDTTLIGHVTASGQVVGKNGKPFIDEFGFELRINDTDGHLIGLINGDGLINVATDELVVWLPARDTCDLDKVRLIHLDGTSVTVDEYDRMQRFIRLWRKIDWTIDDTDKALTGLAASRGAGVAAGGASGGGTSGGTPAAPEICASVSFDIFDDECLAGNGNEGECSNGDGDGAEDGCPDSVATDYTITPEFLHQLRAVNKLLDQSGLPLPNLLAFWADISTDGEKSLYARLFLSHNLLGIDKVFKADAYGNYLTQSARITDHLPVLMAALRLKADDITAIMDFAKMADSLTLPNVSILYRYSLLAKLLHVRIPLLKDVADLFGNPFGGAWDTLGLLETWGSMEDAGFTFSQLNYLVLDRDDSLRPLMPSNKTILQLAKTLFDGLNAIDVAHPDIAPDKKADATSDLVRAKAALLFDAAVVEQMMGLLEGSTVYTTNAPTGLTLAIADTDTLAKKLKYSDKKDATPPTASIQVTGILTDAEIVSAKALANHPSWSKAIVRIGKQAKNVFNDVLFGIFIDTVSAQGKLLAGDFSNPGNSEDPANTAPDKRFYFLQVFLPFLRERLSQRLIVDTASSAASLPSDVTNELLSDILHVGTPHVSAMQALEAIKTRPPGAPTGWQGYLIPSVDADYTFVADSLKDDDQPASITIDGASIAFTVQQEDPSNVWSSDPADPIKLKSGKLYWLAVTDRPAEQLQWKTSTSPNAKIPISALLPDFSSMATKEVFTKLYKAALVVNGFNLSAEEVSYWQSYATFFDNFDFNAVTLQHWQRLQAYADLRNGLPRTETSLLDLFKWASDPASDPTRLSEKIAAATGWNLESIEKLIAPDAKDAKEHFDLNHPQDFRNEVNLVKLRHALAVEDKIAVDIDRLFEWAKPGSKFWACHQIAEDIRNATRARFDQDDWEQVVKPLNDQLREHQKQALISYLLVQPDLLDWGVVDADSLFEFFLIDVQMQACMETSRIKQAISSVQLFIQRCLLGVEEKQVGSKEVGVRNDDIDQHRWEWVKNYRVWEANRKVFLYPENWIISELRDDKSSFYKELESELLQKDINAQTVTDALKNYLFKVDEVANLKVVGLFAEQGTDKAGNPAADNAGKPIYIKLHVFGRTRNAPYFFYYRYFQITEKNWYAWEKLQVDIPSYDLETVDVNGKTLIAENGSYLIPVVWDKRLLIFFPQFSKKAAPNELEKNKVVDYWELKLCWSEYRNNRWTQKQVSADALYHLQNATEPLRPISKFQFLPRTFDGPDSKIVIEVYRGDVGDLSAGGFLFQGSQVSVESGYIALPTALATDFHYVGNTIHSLQSAASGDPPLVLIPPSFRDDTTRVFFNNGGPPVVAYHSFVHALLGTLSAATLDDLFEYFATITDPGDKADAYGQNIGDLSRASPYQELNRPYSLYNWEAAFHAPMLLVDRLLKAQQFDQSLKMCHYVLNPYAKGKGVNDDKRFWQFLPFKEIQSKNVLENLFLKLEPGQPDSEIDEWRNKPFQPHVVARRRPAAYMKWVAMTYIRILIEWGDYLFRQDTIETINQATQLYVLAAHIYGPRGQKISKRGTVLPETYNALLDKWDAFGNAMVEMELAFPFSNQTQLPIDASNGVVGLANIFGFATTLYFCIPDNPELTAVRDTIDDRLFKIRHCENIAGVLRKLPLFEPPNDPALWVQAAAQGLSLSRVLNDLNSPMPNYRFYYLLQKALEVCNELKSMGNAFLSAKEKGDTEAMSRLRATHESNIQNLLMEVKKLQLDEAGKSLDALQQSRKGPVYRLQHFLKLIGDSSSVPDTGIDFKEIAEQIEPPMDDGGLKLISYEKEEMDKAAEAAEKQEDVGAIEVLASIFHALPNISFPLGVPGFSSSLGGSNAGSATQAVARSNQIVAGNRSFSSTNAGRKASFLRQLQDRVQQANVAGYEIKNIDKQALTQQIRINITQQEITNQQKQIDNALEMEDFLRNKYTNQELYSWMESQVRTLYHQAYTLAYDLAKRAEKVFCFERGLSASNFIQFGYWDPAYDGLLAGERLYIGLKQLEAAHQEKLGYDFPIVKNISLQQLNPLALIQLRETGRCEFELPEVLFDMGYPGHYMRRIKSVALTFACHVGPPTSMNCTLRLLEHKFRTSAIVNGKNDYPEHTDETDPRFSTVNVPITAIAVSTGQNDSGVFELNLHDERYLPFEGAGAISKWRIELPQNFREFDYDSITTIDMKLMYTALDGGDKLKSAAEASLQHYIKNVEGLSQDQGLFALFDLPHDFPNAWYKANQPAAGATERVVVLDDLLERLPIFTKGTAPNKIRARDVYLFTSAEIHATAWTLVQNTDQFSFLDSQPAGTMKSFAVKDINNQMTAWHLKIADLNTAVNQLWLVVRYTLG